MKKALIPVPGQTAWVPGAPRTLNCPVRTTLHVLGGKWKLLILSCLLEEPRRYGELRRLIPEITEKMLIQQLRELEEHGIITRTVQQQVPPRVDYALTEQGRLVQPVFEALLGWGLGYLQQAEAVLAEAEASA